MKQTTIVLEVLFDEKEASVNELGSSLYYFVRDPRNGNVLAICKNALEVAKFLTVVTDKLTGTDSAVRE